MWRKLQSFPNGSLSVLVSLAKHFSWTEIAVQALGCMELSQQVCKYPQEEWSSQDAGWKGCHPAIQRHPAMPDKWANGNLMKFNKCKAKCKVLHLGQSNPQYQFRPGDEWIASTPAEKDLGNTSRWKTGWVGNVCSQPRKPIQGYTKRSVTSNAPPLLSSKPTWNIICSSGVPCTRRACTC